MSSNNVSRLFNYVQRLYNGSISVDTLPDDLKNQLSDFCISNIVRAHDAEYSTDKDSFILVDKLNYVEVNGGLPEDAIFDFEVVLEKLNFTNLDIDSLKEYGCVYSKLLDNDEFEITPENVVDYLDLDVMDFVVDYLLYSYECIPEFDVLTLLEYSINSLINLTSNEAKVSLIMNLWETDGLGVSVIPYITLLYNSVPNYLDFISLSSANPHRDTDEVILSTFTTFNIDTVIALSESQDEGYCNIMDFLGDLGESYYYDLDRLEDLVKSVSDLTVDLYDIANEISDIFTFYEDLNSIGEGIDLHQGFSCDDNIELLMHYLDNRFIDYLIS